MVNTPICQRAETQHADVPFELTPLNFPEKIWTIWTAKTATELGLTLF
jgi:hypothetical protein